MSNQFKICPSCGEKNNPTFSVCWKCCTAITAVDMKSSEKSDADVFIEGLHKAVDLLGKGLKVGGQYTKEGKKKVNEILKEFKKNSLTVPNPEKIENVSQAQALTIETIKRMMDETERIYRNHVEAGKAKVTDMGLLRARLYAANFPYQAFVMAEGKMDWDSHQNVFTALLKMLPHGLSLSPDVVQPICEEQTSEHIEALKMEIEMQGSGRNLLAKIYSRALEDSIGPLDKLKGEFADQLPMILGSVVSGALAAWMDLYQKLSEESCAPKKTAHSTSDAGAEASQNSLEGNGAQNKGVSKIDFGKHFYQMKYREHYQMLLDGIKNEEKVLSELYLFRAWTTQFGYRLCCGEGDIAKKIIYEVVNLANTLGQGIFELYNGVKIEEIMNEGIPDLIENRWGEYDDVFLINRGDCDSNFASGPISAKLCNFCEIEDGVKAEWLQKDFLKHLTEIMNEANGLGLIKRA